MNVLHLESRIGFAQLGASDPFLSAELFKIGTTVVNVTTLVTAGCIVLLSFGISRGVRAGLHRFFARGGLAPSGEVGAIERLAHYFIMMMGILIALRTTGIKLDALFTAGAVFAVGFGFAMQNIAQNFVSGVILLFERTIKPGDVISYRRGRFWSGASAKPHAATPAPAS